MRRVGRCAEKNGARDEWRLTQAFTPVVSEQKWCQGHFLRPETTPFDTLEGLPCAALLLFSNTPRPARWRGSKNGAKDIYPARCPVLFPSRGLFGPPRPSQPGKVSRPRFHPRLEPMRPEGLLLVHIVADHVQLPVAQGFVEQVPISLCP